MIYIGADHRGFALKEKIATWLFDMQQEFFDVGANHVDEKDDYTLYASEVASLVSANKNSLGILICGSGVGVEVVANKFDGVRAGLGKSPDQIAAGRRDDDMNVLVIAADYTSEEEARKILESFLNTPFNAKIRHTKRLNDIKKIEANN